MGSKHKQLQSELKESGDKIHFFSNAADVIGIIFMKFDTEMEMTDTVETINKKIRIILAGDKFF